MNFLIFASFPNSILSFRGDLLREIKSKGWNVHVVAPGLGESSVFRRELELNGFFVHNLFMHRTSLNPIFDFFSLCRLIFLVLKIRPDVFFAYTIKPVVYGLLIARILGVPKRFGLITGLGYAFSNDGSPGLLRKMLGAFARQLYRLSLSGAEAVFFQNPDDRELFRFQRILKRQAYTCVVNGSGVDIKYFRVAPLPAEVRFLMIGRFLGAKGVREYVEAARIIRAQRQGVFFDLVGWIDDNPDAIAKDELNDWIACGIINYVGRLDDVRPAIANASVFVLPSYREGTPRTVLEAMSMGRAVITTDAPGCKETVVSGENGFLIPVASVDDLVGAMIRFLDNPSLAEKMGRKARDLVVWKYDVRKINALMLHEMGIT